MSAGRPLLSVVIPVYNQAGAIADNVATIRERVAAGVDGRVELIVVSDGSLDGTERAVLERRLPDTRVLHYLRNLGKGYALKMGALEAHGAWVAFVDADLDLDPGAVPGYLEHARTQGLDYVIGSKRHPASRVHYPRSRRVASWLYQRLVRLLFRLDVRDTQVGLKVFRRELLDDVLPLLLVKRYAFDLELLAVARALGYARGEEMPVVLDYRFTGSGVRSSAVLRALVDTFAIAYRLHVLRYYQRRRGLAAGPRHAEALAVTLVRVEGEPVPELEGAEPTHVTVSHDDARTSAEAAQRAETELVAFLEPNAVPAANWLSAGAAFFAAAEVGAVVTPALAPADGPLAERGAAALRESRLGGGSMYFRFTPGNIHFVDRFPAASVIVRRDLYLRVAPVEREDLCAALLATGTRVLYTPETVVVIRPAPLVAPHLAQTWAHGLRQARPAPVSTVLAVLGFAFVLFGWSLAWAGRGPRLIWLAALAAYALAVVTAAAVATLRFRSPAVGLAALAAFPLTHLVYAAAVVRGLARRS